MTAINRNIFRTPAVDLTVRQALENVADSVIGDPHTVAFFGDSITNSAGQAMLFGYRISTTSNGFVSANWVILGADPETPSGVGSWAYNSGTKLATWTPFGSSAGAAVDLTHSGIFYLPGPSAKQGLTIVWDGDNTSYTTGTTTVTVPADGNQYQAIYNARGFAPVALMLAGPGWDFATTTAYPYGIACGGVPGFGSAILASTVWQANSITSDVDVIEIGTNDVASSVAATTIIANIKTFVLSRIALGSKRIGVLTIPPRDANTAAMNKIRAAVNRWIYEYSQSTGKIDCLDIAAAVTDPSNAHWVSGLSGDGIHPSCLGAYRIAKVVSDWLVSLNPARPYRPEYSDLWDTTANPYGSLIPAAGYNTFEGTGGTAGTGASGTIPANYTLARQVGSNILGAGSKVARTDNVAGSWYQVDLSAATAASSPWEYMRLYPQTNAQNLSTYGLAAGDPLEFLAEINIPASSGLVHLNAILSFGSVSARTIECLTDSIIGSNSVLQDNMGRIWLRSPKGATVPVGATTFSVTFRMGTINGGTATIQFGGWSLRKMRVGAP